MLLNQLLKLTKKPNNESVYIHPQRVDAVYSDGHRGTVVLLVHRSLEVEESVEEVVVEWRKLLNEPYTHQELLTHDHRERTKNALEDALTNAGRELMMEEERRAKEG